MENGLDEVEFVDTERSALQMYTAVDLVSRSFFPEVERGVAQSGSLIRMSHQGDKGGVAFSVMAAIKHSGRA